VTDRHFDVDVDDDLNARVDLVNRQNPDLFLSVHTNYVDNPGPRGFEVWVPKNARGARNAESRRLAQNLLAELGGVWQSEDRGIKDDHNLRVLKGTTCPAALVELEFVSNPAAERELAKATKRRQLADAIAEAVRRWFVDRR
jgi:N-acetylmuramoyl-L-alanine amidase